MLFTLKSEAPLMMLDLTIIDNFTTTMEPPTNL